MSEPGKVVTFYSYKGGTGRTMALANTGVALARKGGGPVLMIDWDLEAPGLPEFFPEIDARRSNEAETGVLELFEEAWDRTKHGSQSDRQSCRALWRDLSPERCVVETAEPTLHMMRAGVVGDGYGTRVNAFPWRELFERSPEVFEGFAEEMASRYRYVLIDSRTGLADTSGICTTLIPDHLVVVFTPNRQSLTGVIDLVRKATLYRGRSPDLRPLLVFPLASRVEMSEEELRREWRYGNKSVSGYQPLFEGLFEEVYDLRRCELERYFDEVQVQHATRYAYGERVAVRDEHSDRLSLARSYERFARALIEGDPPWAFEANAAPRQLDADDDSLLDRVVPLRKAHQARARNARTFDIYALALEGVTLLLGIGFAISTLAEERALSYRLSWFFPLIITLGFIELARKRLAFRQRSVIHARAANSLERERMLYTASAGPYRSREAPSALLAERIDEIEADAEIALLEPRDLPRLLKPGRDDERSSR